MNGKVTKKEGLENWKKMKKGLEHYGKNNPIVFEETIRYIKQDIPYDFVLSKAIDGLGKKDLIKRIEKLRREELSKNK